MEALILERYQFLEGIETEIEIEFENQEEAEIVLEAIKPEIDGSPSDRTSVSINIQESRLKMIINADDSASFRASINSYLRWIKLSKEIIDLKNEYSENQIN
jgi:KEOPS complex subunit Pcc1